MELPNTDIFDPIACVRMWERYATQQEINAYLSKQIDRNRQVLKETIATQKEINSASDKTLKDHETRIASLESGLSALDKAQSDLNTAFQALQTDNNNFKSNVDLLLNQYQTTINLLQSNIDKITVSNEELWNEVNKLKSQFDPDKLDAAIAGYESVLSDAKKYADDINADLQGKIDALSKEVDANKISFEDALKEESQTRKTEISNFEQEVRSSLVQQTADINAFMTAVNAYNAQQKLWVETELERFDKRLTKLENKVDANYEANGNTHTELKAAIEKVAKDAQDKLDGLKADVDGRFNKMDGDIANEFSDVRETINTEIGKLQEQITAIKADRGAMWTTINNVVTTQNAINEKLENLNAYINEQIGLVKTDIKTNEDAIRYLEDSLDTTKERVFRNEHLTGCEYYLQLPYSNDVAKTSVIDFYKFKITVEIAGGRATGVFEMVGNTTGIISVPSVSYGRPTVISNTKFNISTSLTDPQFIQAYIYTSNDDPYVNEDGLPAPLTITYNPAHPYIVFKLGYLNPRRYMGEEGIPPTVE